MYSSLLVSAESMNVLVVEYFLQRWLTHPPTERSFIAIVCVLSTVNCTFCTTYVVSTESTTMLYERF